MGKFFLKNFSPVVYIQKKQRVMGIILRYVCWGIPPPPLGSPAVWVNGRAIDAARVRRRDLAVWPDQAAAASSAPSGFEPSP